MEDFLKKYWERKKKYEVLIQSKKIEGIYNPFKEAGLRFEAYHSMRDVTWYRDVYGVFIIFDSKAKQIFIRFKKKNTLIAYDLLGFYYLDLEGTISFNEGNAKKNITFEEVLDGLQDENEILLRTEDVGFIDEAAYTIVYMIDENHEDDYYSRIEGQKIKNQLKKDPNSFYISN